MDELLTLIDTSLDSDEARRILSAFNFGAEDEDDRELSRMTGEKFLCDNASGLEIQSSRKGIIKTIFLKGEGNEGCSEFTGDLPGGLTFQSTSTDVRAALGEPSVDRPKYNWLRYDTDRHSCHFSFRDGDGRLKMVTLMAPDQVP